MKDLLRSFEALADALKCGFVVSALDDKILVANAAIACILDEPGVDSVVGRHMPSFWPPDAETHHPTDILPALMRDGRWHGECKLLTRTGHLAPVEVGCFLIRNEHGQTRYVGWIFHDDTAGEKAHAYSERERTIQEAIIDALPGVFYLIDEQGRFVQWNTNLERVSGRDTRTLANTSPLELFSATDADRIADAIGIVFREGSAEVEGTLVSTTGTATPFMFSGHRIALDGKAHLIGVGVDVSELKRTERERALLASAFDYGASAVVITDANNRIVAINTAFTRLTGFTLDDVTGQNPAMLSSGLMPETVYDDMWEAIRQTGYWHGEVWDRRKDGSIFPKWLSISTIRNEHGQITNHIASFTDLTESKRTEEKIRFLALHDALTALPNRVELQSRLTQALATARRENFRLAVLFLDLDHFKLINDTLGHTVGDQLLVEVARRLLASVRKSDIVGRLGGDEFVIVLNHVETPATIATLTEKLLERLEQPFMMDGRQLHTAASIGISVFPQDGDTCETLMRCADIAMYHAKASGRSTFQFFDTSLNRAAEQRLHLQQRLRSAISGEQLVLHYQPQIERASGAIVAVEALVRWLDPDEGLIPPDRFIPVAEESGLICQIGDWVLDKALHQLALWRDSGLHSLRMAVNLSVNQLRLRDLPASIAKALARHQVPADRLTLEITESAAMSDPVLTTEVLTQLKAMGIHLAIDDFGTGYSSLAYLKLLPVGTLKLDRSFVQDMDTNTNDAAICAATIALAHTLELKVVAEGVETLGQLSRLCTLNCDFLQGYHFSPPVEAEKVFALLTVRYPTMGSPVA